MQEMAKIGSVHIQSDRRTHPDDFARVAAAHAYRTFVDNWADADTALILLRDARRRLLALAR